MIEDLGKREYHESAGQSHFGSIETDLFRSYVCLFFLLRLPENTIEKLTWRDQDDSSTYQCNLKGRSTLDLEYRIVGPEIGKAFLACALPLATETLEEALHDGKHI